MCYSSWFRNNSIALSAVASSSAGASSNWSSSGVSQMQNAPLGNEPCGALCLMFLVNQCLKRNSFTISSSAALSCRGVPHTLLLLIASGVRADNDDDSNYQSNPLRNMHYGGLEGLEVGACGANEAGRCYRSEILVAFSQKHNLASVLLISSENTSLPQRFRDLCTSLRDLWYAKFHSAAFGAK